MSLALTIVGLLAGATIVLNLEESAELPLETAVKVIDALGHAITERTGGKVIIDDPTWSGCKRDDRCLIDIAARTQANDVVLVRVFGGALSHRLIAEHFRGRVIEGRGEVDLSSEDLESWSAALGPLVVSLFPIVEARRAEPALTPATNVPVVPASFSPWPWVVIGSAAAIAVAGVVFGANSASAARRIETEVLPEDEHNALLRRGSRDQTVANTLFVSAGVLATGGLIWLFSE